MALVIWWILLRWKWGAIPDASPDVGGNIEISASRRGSQWVGLIKPTPVSSNYYPTSDRNRLKPKPGPDYRWYLEHLFMDRVCTCFSWPDVTCELAHVVRLVLGGLSQPDDEVGRALPRMWRPIR